MSVIAVEKEGKINSGLVFTISLLRLHVKKQILKGTDMTKRKER